MRFSKPPLSYDAQVDQLISRGLSVPDRDKAIHYLANLNYYRLGAYWLALEIDHATHRFREGSNFDEVLNLYVFDREFRLLVMDAIERVEVSIRARWAYNLAHDYGSHAHLDRGLFRRSWRYDRYRSSLLKSVQDSNETFIHHLRSTYQEELPPIWALVEIMSFGQLSQWYANTARRSDRNKVARLYGMDEKILVSLLHHLTTVRNLCAHHARLWNREFTVTPQLPRSSPETLQRSLWGGSGRKIYNTLALVVFLLDQINPGHHFRQRLCLLILNHRIDDTAMGFPPEWKELPLWKVVGT